MLTGRSFRDLCSADQKLALRLAEIEQEDEDRCASCGGEDCICCEYYIDRQKWVDPDELFDHSGDLLYDYWEA